MRQTCLVTIYYVMALLVCFGFVLHSVIRATWIMNIMDGILETGVYIAVVAAFVHTVTYAKVGKLRTGHNEVGKFTDIFSSTPPLP